MAPVLTQNYVVAPPVEALKGTLLDAASVSDGLEWLHEDSVFETYNCMKFESAADFCTPTAKTFDQEAGWEDGFKFAVYGGVKCRAVGLDQNNMLRQVESVFQRGESTAVERALMETRFVAAATRWAAPTDVTPAGGAVSPEVGVGILEGYAGSVYVGAPTIHVPRSIASLLIGRQAAEFEGSEFRTQLGSKIAAGVGYDFPNTGPTGAAAAAGEKWLYATGGVAVRRGSSIVRQVMAHNDNEVYVLAERGYVVAVDCFAAAVRVTLA
jgi:hypothetical protein